MDTYAVYISYYGSYTGETRPATRDNANVFKRVLTLFALTIGMVVKICDGLTQV